MTKLTVLLPLLAAAAIVPAARAAEPALEKVTVRATARFDFDRAALDAADRDAILAEVARLKDVSWQSVRATGHADAIGADAYNVGLSARRADAVKAYLVGKGLDASMIRTDAKGSAAPVADNGSAAGRAQNRRTEIEFQGVRPVPAK